MIDTHCHLDAERFEPDRDEVLARAWRAGVEAIVLPGVAPDQWGALGELAAQDARLLLALGIHPQVVPDLPPESDARHLSELDARLATPSVVAVGECGLDGPSVARGASAERQLTIAGEHLRLARRHALPVLLHCYRMHPQLLELLASEPLPEAGVVLHSYSGGPELVARYAALGCHFSFAGPVTWPEARRPVAAAQAVPLERLLVETDAPDQAPTPFRGQRSEPAHVAETIAALARLRGMPTEEMAELTSANARRLFRRPRPPR